MMWSTSRVASPKTSRLRVSVATQTSPTWTASRLTQIWYWASFKHHSISRVRLGTPSQAHTLMRGILCFSIRSKLPQGTGCLPWICWVKKTQPRKRSRISRGRHLGIRTTMAHQIRRIKWQHKGQVAKIFTWRTLMTKPLNSYTFHLSKRGISLKKSCSRTYGRLRTIPSSQMEVGMGAVSKANKRSRFNKNPLMKRRMKPSRNTIWLKTMTRLIWCWTMIIQKWRATRQPQWGTSMIFMRARSHSWSASKWVNSSSRVTSSQIIKCPSMLKVAVRTCKTTRSWTTHSTTKRTDTS